MPNAKGTYSLKGFISRFDDETCRDYLAHIRWHGKPRCQQCGNNKGNYKYTSRPIYKCVSCGTQFRATTGTIFEDSKVPLSDWFLAIKLVACTKKSISSYQLAKELGVTQKTAWYMETNIRIEPLREAYVWNDKTKNHDIPQFTVTYFNGKNEEWDAFDVEFDLKEYIESIQFTTDEYDIEDHVLPELKALGYVKNKNATRFSHALNTKLSGQSIDTPDTEFYYDSPGKKCSVVITFIGNKRYSVKVLGK